MTKKALGRGLPNHVKEREMKDEFAKIIDAWRSEGYNVSRLDGILDLDIDSISQAFTLFDNDVRNLRDLAEIINLMETEGFESEVESIRSKLKEPDQTTDVLQEVHDLDQKIKTKKESEYRAKAEKKVEAWSSTLESGKSELMDLWEKSEQEAMIKDPSVLQKATEDTRDSKSDDDLENRLSNIRQRLNKLNLDKSIPLRSDKIDIPEKQDTETPAKTPEPEKQADTVSPEEPPETGTSETEKPEEPTEVETINENEPDIRETAPGPEEQPEESVTEPETKSTDVPETEPTTTSPEPTQPPQPPVAETNLTDTQKTELEEALKIAKEMYRKQEYEKAIEYFDMALEIDPLNSDANFFKKRAESRMG